ncbi:unnamed protein product [Ectocarpus sp. 12 AP-2014]
MHTWWYVCYVEYSISKNDSYLCSQNDLDAGGRLVCSRRDWVLNMTVKAFESWNSRVTNITSAYKVSCTRRIGVICCHNDAKLMWLPFVHVLVKSQFPPSRD